MSITGQDLAAIFQKRPLSVGCGLAALLLAGVIYYRFDLLPAAEEQLEQRTQEGERLTNNLKNSLLLQEQFDALVAANAEINSRALRLGALATNLQYFYRLEADTDTKLNELRQLAPATVRGPAPKYLRIPYALSIQGDYPKVMTFLRRLETGIHFCRINSVTMSPAKGVGPNDVLLSLTIEVLGVP